MQARIIIEVSESTGASGCDLHLRWPSWQYIKHGLFSRDLRLKLTYHAKTGLYTRHYLKKTEQQLTIHCQTQFHLND